MNIPLCHAQYWEFEKPVYEKIQQAVMDEASSLHYDKLLRRFQDADTTLSLTEKRHLYYGFVFHPNYVPDSGVAFKDSLELILEKTEHHQTDLSLLVNYASKILKKHPFDLEVMNYQLYAFETLQDTARMKHVLAKMDMVFQAMLSSGDGATKASAFYVIDPAHEHQLIHILGMKFEGKQSLSTNYDYLELAANDIGLEGLYFEISPYLNAHREVTLGKK